MSFAHIPLFIIVQSSIDTSPSNNMIIHLTLSYKCAVRLVLVRNEANRFNRDGRDGDAKDEMMKGKKYCAHRVFFHLDHRAQKYNQDRFQLYKQHFYFKETFTTFVLLA